MDRRRARVLRWLSATGVALVALAAVATASASHPTLTYDSTFQYGNENWWAIEGSNFNGMTWQASGGNPDGYITTDFASGGGLVQSVPNGAGSTWPAGNALGNYGGTLGADVRVTLNGTSSTEGLLLGFFSSNSVHWVCAKQVTPTSSWVPYSVTLDTGNLLDCLSGKPLTGAQVSAALAGFEAMLILTGNNDSVGETVDVDNATLSPPVAAAAPPTGNVKRSVVLKYKRRKLTGSVLAPDDFSCAGKAKVTIFEKGKKPVKVGSATTGPADPQRLAAPASFSLKLKKGVKGKLYASFAKSTSKLDGNRCLAATSKTVTVR